MSSGIVSMRVRSVSPILMHNPAGLMKKATGEIERGGKKIPLPEDEARAGLYVLPNGQLYIPADAFREAGLGAAADIRDPSRKGRATMTRRFGASVFLSRAEAPLYRPSTNSNGDLGPALTESPEDWSVYVKRVVVQKAGIMRARARIDEWQADLEFEYDPETIEPDLVVMCMHQAGKFPGILDYRVGKKGPFGRFSVERLA